MAPVKYLMLLSSQMHRQIADTSETRTTSIIYRPIMHCSSAEIRVTPNAEHEVVQQNVSSLLGNYVLIAVV